MKYGGQIDGQMSSQSPVVWGYREVVGMCVEAGPVLKMQHEKLLVQYLCSSIVGTSG
jgi:hypothetical protein